MAPTQALLDKSELLLPDRQQSPVPTYCLFHSLWCQVPDTYGFLPRFGLQNRQPESLVRHQKITGAVKSAHHPAENDILIGSLKCNFPSLSELHNLRFLLSSQSALIRKAGRRPPCLPAFLIWRQRQAICLQPSPDFSPEVLVEWLNAARTAPVWVLPRGAVLRACFESSALVGADAKRRAQLLTDFPR